MITLKIINNPIVLKSVAYNPDITITWDFWDVVPMDFIMTFINIYFTPSSFTYRISPNNLNYKSQGGFTLETKGNIILQESE